MSDEMRLFRVESGGATYSVVAADEAGALALVRAYEEDVWDGDDVTAAPIDEATARTRVVRGDGEPDATLWALFEADRTPHIVACSEWP